MKGIRMTLVALVALAMGAFAASAQAKDKVDVCKHGCDYRTIQDAVDDTGKKAVINVEPGTYREGVVVEGSKHDGITIQGTSKDASDVVLQGKRAKDPNGPAGQQRHRDAQGRRRRAFSTSPPRTTSPTASTSSTATDTWQRT